MNRAEELMILVDYLAETGSFSEELVEWLRRIAERSRRRKPAGTIAIGGSQNAQGFNLKGEWLEVPHVESPVSLNLANLEDLEALAEHVVFVKERYARRRFEWEAWIPEGEEMSVEVRLIGEDTNIAAEDVLRANSTP